MMRSKGIDCFFLLCAHMAGMRGPPRCIKGNTCPHVHLDDPKRLPLEAIVREKPKSSHQKFLEEVRAAGYLATIEGQLTYKTGFTIVYYFRPYHYSEHQALQRTVGTLVDTVGTYVLSIIIIIILLLIIISFFSSSSLSLSSYYPQSHAATSRLTLNKTSSTHPLQPYTNILFTHALKSSQNISLA